MSKLCDDKLTTRCVSRVVCDVDDVEEEASCMMTDCVMTSCVDK